jgi:hypothetical protein
MYAIRAKNGRPFRRSGLTFSHAHWTLVKKPTDAILDEPQLEILKSVKGDDDPRLAGMEVVEANEDEIIQPAESPEPEPAPMIPAPLSAEIQSAVQEAVAAALAEQQAADSKPAPRGRRAANKAADATDENAPLHGTEADPGATPVNSNVELSATEPAMGPNVSQLSPEQAAVQSE